MKLQHWLWILILICLLVSSPNIMLRLQNEATYHTYNMTVPYEEILRTAEEQNISITHALESFQHAGVNAISFAPLSLENLQNQGRIMVYEQKEFEKILQLSNHSLYPAEQAGIYITEPESLEDLAKIKEQFKTIPLSYNGKDFYFIPNPQKNIVNIPIGYDDEAINLIKQLGFYTVLQLKNQELPEQNQFQLQQAISHQPDAISFTGNEVIGYPENIDVKKFANQIAEAEITGYFQEMNPTAGIQSFAQSVNFQLIRMHQIDLNEVPLETAINRAVRGIKERHIQSIFLHIPTDDFNHPAETINQLQMGLKEKLPAYFMLGFPAPLSSTDAPVWSKALAWISGIIFLFLAASTFRYSPLQWLLGFAGALLTLLFFLFQKIIFLQAFILLIAMITPLFAILSQTFRTTSNITVTYLRTLLISLVGILILISVSNEGSLITGVEVFRGVKLMHIIPLLVMAIYIILPYLNRTTLKKSITLGHALFCLLGVMFIGILGYLYISRTGNYGIANEWELTIRQVLEDLLYVRPRTKEFLIGFPLFLLAIYLMKRNIKHWGRLLLIPSTIGFLSIINTFMHFHTPLAISALRTLYSIVLGYLLGMLMIFCFKIIHRLYKRRFC
ncbi:DUF5693 family protein [Ornithinibacillus sp. 4-3]|uniref:DUF5693 family protein n=1 Tax=Ornithinibacillus sp. 4-3 TaxID=3231488 RepID=A0AB39HPK1_9BACI